MPLLTEEYATFKAELDTAIDNALIMDIARRLEDYVMKSVYENVYAPYDAVRKTWGYERRQEDGGLTDSSNYSSWVSDGHVLELENNTQGNDRYADSEGWDSGYITDIIENGGDYHWTNSSIYGLQPFPRPFMEEALDAFVDSGEADEMLANGLRRQGIDVV